MSSVTKGQLRYAVPLAAVWLLSACTDGDREQPLTRVEPIDIPAGDTTTTVNVNINNPTLTIPDTFPVSDGDVLTLVWSDEFDGAQLDPQVWFFETGDGSQYGIPGWGNNELQYYLPDNARLEDGKLKIEARRETVGDFGFTSARINTRDRFAFRYGRIEASIKLPSGQGLWPAFWMLSQDSPYGVWAATGEIDIVEAVNLDGSPGPGGIGGGNEIFATIHYGGEFPANERSEVRYTPSEDVSADFNTYALEWDEFEMRWYFNGSLYAVQNNWFSTAAPYPAPFDQPFHILLNLAVGGNFPGSPDGSTPFPSSMEVDWVRVYSGEEPVIGPVDPGIIPDDVIYATDPNETVDIVFGVDYTGFEPFGSGSTFDNNNTSDASFSPAFGVTTGNGYGAQVGQFAIVGFAPGFATGYESLVFKAKNLNNDLIRVKFLDDGDYIDIDLTTSGYSTALGNGWYQVVVPIADFTGVDTATALLFETDNTAPNSFTFLLTDFGFSGTGGGGVDPGIIPEAVVYATDPGVVEDLAPAGIDNFGSGAVFDGNFAGDPDFNPAFQVTSGEGYGAGVHVGFVAFTGYGAGFASGYENFVFKTKVNAPGSATAYEVKFIGGGDTSQVYDLTTYAGATDLGNGWYQVSVPMTDFAATVAANDGFLLGPLGGQAGAFTMLLTDIGFTTGGGGSGELTTNGGFEDGTTDGWAVFENDGTATLESGDASEGTYSINATIAAPPGGVPAPAPVVLKQESIGIGTVGTGETISVTFDLKGTVANGAIVSVEFFSERALGADLTILDTINAPNANWTSYGPYTPTTSDDVTRGITLQFVVICGAVDGCAADVDIDNVSVAQAGGG